MSDRNASAALLAGLNRVAHSRLEEALTIPPASGQSGAESLNVAVAAAIVCSEFHRRKK